MQRASKLIKANETHFPDHTYYLPLFAKARRNAQSHPDICIETCKALLEGISKTIILGLDPLATRDELNKKDVEPLVKTAAKLLRANDDVIEDHFINRVGGVAHALGALRSARGDISHGKAVPKLECSSNYFARLCLQMTDAIAFYMLQSFFAAKQAAAVTSQPKEEEAEGEPIAEDLPGGILNVAYDDYPEFNDELDRRHPLDGKLLYSHALYQLYYEDYVIALEDHLDGQGNASPTDESDHVNP